MKNRTFLFRYRNTSLNNKRAWTYSRTNRFANRLIFVIVVTHNGRFGNHDVTTTITPQKTSVV